MMRKLTYVWFFLSCLLIDSEGETSLYNHVPAQRRSQSNSFIQHDESSLAGVPFGAAEKPAASNIEDIVADGIYWSEPVEALLPPPVGGLCTDSSSLHSFCSSQWSHKAHTLPVVRAEAGLCGRDPNRLLTFSDGTRVCARYRDNSERVHGDLLAYRLATDLLNLTGSVLPSVPVLYDPRSSQWATVRSELWEAGWGRRVHGVDNRLKELKAVVSLSPYVDGLVPIFLPSVLKSGLFGSGSSPGTKDDNPRTHFTMDDNNEAVGESESLPLGKGKSVARLHSLSTDALSEIVQWTDLLVFDYLTANPDRAAGSLHLHQWNAGIVDAAVHNALADKTGRIYLLDNESSFFHGYRILDRFSSYHERLLKSVCVFRRSTVAHVEEAAKKNDPMAVLEKGLASKGVEMESRFPTITDNVKNVLRKRLNYVKDHFQWCRTNTN